MKATWAVISIIITFGRTVPVNAQAIEDIIIRDAVTLCNGQLSDNANNLGDLIKKFRPGRENLLNTSGPLSILRDKSIYRVSLEQSTVTNISIEKNGITAVYFNSIEDIAWIVHLSNRGEMTRRDLDRSTIDGVLLVTGAFLRGQISGEFPAWAESGKIYLISKNLRELERHQFHFVDFDSMALEVAKEKAKADNHILFIAAQKLLINRGKAKSNIENVSKQADGISSCMKNYKSNKIEECLDANKLIDHAIKYIPNPINQNGLRQFMSNQRVVSVIQFQENETIALMDAQSLDRKVYFGIISFDGDHFKAVNIVQY